jgi:hypothetical protein
MQERYPPASLRRLENVCKSRYFRRMQWCATRAAHQTAQAAACKGLVRFWRWPLALGLAIAMVVALFHDLPAFAGKIDSGPPTLAAAVASTSAPVQAPDSQAPGHSCHCLCHVAPQALASPVVTPVAFGSSLDLPPGNTPPRSCAGLPPFRPPRV